MNIDASLQFQRLFQKYGLSDLTMHLVLMLMMAHLNKTICLSCVSTGFIIRIWSIFPLNKVSFRLFNQIYVNVSVYFGAFQKY